MESAMHFWPRLNRFFVVGISYKNASAEIRGKYSISEKTAETIYAELKKDSAHQECFIISTCNRTEIYCYGSQTSYAISLWNKLTGSNLSELMSQLYIYQGEEAVKHFFSVGSGLDSQILGDYEITGQIKKAFANARNCQATGSITERLFSIMQHVSKNVRNNTEICKGSVSVANFAVNCILKYLESQPESKILLLGTGKIGVNTLKNLAGHVNPEKIFISNRTEEKALRVAESNNVQSIPFESFHQSLEFINVVVVATQAEEPLLNLQHVRGSAVGLILDLSIPRNVNDDIRELSHINLFDVDALSAMCDGTIEMRRRAIPSALSYINDGIELFTAWLKERGSYENVHGFRNRIITRHFAKTDDASNDMREAINSHCNQFFIREAKQHAPHGCRYLELVNELLEYSNI